MRNTWGYDNWEIKKSNLCYSEGEDMEEATGVERKVAI